MYFKPLVHFSARSPQGFRASLKGVACSVAVVIGLSLSIAGASSSEASIDAIKSVKTLAAKQLTDQQYHCHNQIVYRESRWKIDAVNGSHHGLCQGRSKYMAKANYKQQVQWCIAYAYNRYGSITLALEHWRLHKWH